MFRPERFKQFPEFDLQERRSQTLRPHPVADAQLVLGGSKQCTARFYKIPPERVLVISDDVALPQGKLRVRRSGSAGGHNGLKNIIAHLGSDQFPRVKVGVGGKPHPDSDMADWVLSPFTGQDRKAMEEAISRAADAVTLLLDQGVDQAMAKFNG